MLENKANGGLLYKYLRQQGKPYRKRYGHVNNRTGIANRVDIDERVSKLRLVYPVDSRHKDKVSATLSVMLNPVQRFVRSITYDKGKDFAGHGQVNKAIACCSYFAKPYRSWERGQNENANGFLRQYFLKKMSLGSIAYNKLTIAVNKLNHRSRKCLKFKTPCQVSCEMTAETLVNSDRCVYDANPP